MHSQAFQPHDFHNLHISMIFYKVFQKLFLLHIIFLETIFCNNKIGAWISIHMWHWAFFCRLLLHLSSQMVVHFLFKSFCNNKMVYIHKFSNIFISISFFYKINIFILVLWVWNYDWTIAIKIYSIWFVHNVSTYLLSFTQEKIEHKMHSYFAIFIFSFEHAIFKDVFSMFLLHFWIYVDLCLQTCIPFKIFLQRLFFHFCFIHEYFPCIPPWILFSFSNNCSIFQFSQKNATRRVEGKKTIWSNKIYQPWKIKVQKFTKQSTHISLIVKKCK
jgi:hypothetical protein